jgi:hypothetical protein
MAQREPEPLEIAIIEVGQYFEVDVIRLERIKILLQIVGTQPVTQVAHTILPTPL